MKPLFHHSSSILLFFYAVVLLLISIINIPTCMCDDDDYYKNCNNAFTCEGSNKPNNLKYPFWGNNRKKYCGGSGDSNTELTCEGSVPKITINSVKYRILDWDDSKAQKLTIARDDYWNGICAVSTSANNKFNSTFENTPFQLDGDVSSVLNLLYNCDTNQPSGMYSTTCNNIKVVYTLTPGSVTCTPTVIVEFPIMVNQGVGIATANAINQTLQGGFDLRWNGYGECQECIGSGGACGNDGGTGFRCFCEDGTHTTSCKSSKASPPPSSSMSFAFYITLLTFFLQLVIIDL